MTHTRRSFLAAAAAAGAAPILLGDPLLRLLPSVAAQARKVFRHGVASGDPLADRVILWTRVSGSGLTARPRVRWEIARDEAFRQIAGRGELFTNASRDFTVKIDVPHLEPGSTYYYRFEAEGERSPVGRTRTLPGADVSRLRLALTSCSNMPFGYFNAYRGLASRHDLDAVLHLGDYIYEYANGRYGDGTKFGRASLPDREIVSLEDYRTRHAQYKTDPDLQEAHRQHPWIVVWDDHEFANNAWRDGAQNHQPDTEGAWPERRDAAVRAYYEWMPIRDQEAPRREQLELIEDPARSILGPTQEQWLFAELAQSKKRGATWQLLGQQVMFSPMAPSGQPAGNKDAWDGYRPARNRVLDFVADHQISNTVVLTGDVHSSWAYDVTKDPWSGYDPTTGRGTTAIEIVTPSVTSPSGWGDAGAAKERLTKLLAERPHLKWAEGLSKGYVLLDLTPSAVQADWYFVDTIESREHRASFAKGFRSEAGNPHLIEVPSPAK